MCVCPVDCLKSYSNTSESSILVTILLKEFLHLKQY